MKTTMAREFANSWVGKLAPTPENEPEITRAKIMVPGIHGVISYPYQVLPGTV
jgi:hypothetical protein